jgi:uncharacterized damage-inducible protein DinB
METPELSLLLTIIDQAFDHKSWHGTNLRGSIKGMKAEDAARRPSPERHNIWEIVLHAAYWKYIVRRRLLSEARGSFPLKGSDWFKRPEGVEPMEAEWKKDVALLVETHRTLREAVAQMKPDEIHHTPSDSKVSNLELITGIASHDLYHAGQIQLLKRLRPLK